MTNLALRYRGSYGLRFQVLTALAVFSHRVKYWAWGGVLDAARVAKRGDTALAEFGVGLVTLVSGAWCAVLPQPFYNVFGFMSRAVNSPVPLSLLGGAALLLAGRAMLHALVCGSSRKRCAAARLVAASWAVLLFNQLLLNVSGLGVVFYAGGVLCSVYIHERICPRKGGDSHECREARHGGAGEKAHDLVSDAQRDCGLLEQSRR